MSFKISKNDSFYFQWPYRIDFDDGRAVVIGDNPLEIQCAFGIEPMCKFLQNGSCTKIKPSSTNVKYLEPICFTKEDNIENILSLLEL